ncbi:hypothetical protein M885DRAFT_563038 [Pelagophyceae sp. CCMP2097]|nr:hypothetical protein M885DRAFT_563038 [Pelagophyceae sp. CCMP2097]
MRTQCGHYFCSKCANKRFRTNTRCPVCDKQTSGVLNAAPKLAAKAKLVGGYEALLASALVDSSPADDGAPADAYQNEAVAPVPHVAALAKKFAPKPMPKTSGDWSVVNF